MPLYDFRCRTCDAVFEQRRPMAEADAPAVCPEGHAETVRLLPVFAAARSSAGSSAAPAPAPVAGGGCGGACACRG